MKADIDLVKETMTTEQVDPVKTERVIKRIVEAIDSEKAEKVREGHTKKQYIVAVSQDAGIVTEPCMGFVFRIPEDASPAEIEERINALGNEFNDSRKGRQYPAANIEDVAASATAAQQIKAECWVSSREPVWIMPIPFAVGAVKDAVAARKNHEKGK